MDKYEHQYVFDIITSQMERTIRRLWIMCIVLIVLLVGSNLMWLMYENQFSTVTETTTTQEVNQDGDNNIVVGRDYGTSNGKDHNNH